VEVEPRRRREWAATAIARFPVEAQATVSKPSSLPWMATATARGPEEWGGFAVVFLIQKLGKPDAGRRAGRRGSGGQARLQRSPGRPSTAEVE